MANLITNLLGTILSGSSKETKVNNKKYEGSWADTNSSYSASDIVATVSIHTHTGVAVTAVLGELQTISYSIHQEKAPVRSLGNINAQTYVMGPRTIAGSLCMAVFNKHWMEDIYTKIEKNAKMKNSKFITDEIPVFDIIASFTNEYGFESYLSIHNIHIINEGQVMSSSDIFVENTFQYVAEDIQLLTSSETPISNASKKRTAIISSTSSTTNSSEKNNNVQTTANQLSTKNTIKAKPIAVKEESENEGKK